MRITRNFKIAVISVIVLFVVVVLGYSLYITLNSEKAIVVCPDETTCFWSAHVHAYIPITICGETEYRSPVEVGSLTGPHTHEEKNVIHWHDRLPYDNVTKTILDIKPLTLGSYFKNIDATFTEHVLLDKENGDLCPDNRPGSVMMFVNGKLNTEFQNYIWRDRDVIELFFDTRSLEEVGDEVRENPLTFPSLGRG